MSLFGEFTGRFDLDDPEFSKATRVHDWRNYVPVEIKQEWNHLTEREKKIVFLLANEQANAEIWD
jgi:hypothetical protein